MKKYIYFSATNTTGKVMAALGAESSDIINVTLEKPSEESLDFTNEDLIFLGFPVFGGRVPEIYLKRIEALKGNGAKAVVVAVYGNRHYDDSIKEMQAWAEAHGCEVVAAIAAVARHSIAPSIAAGRPDKDDLMRLREFKEEIERRYESKELKPMPKRPRDEQYKEYRQLPILPESTEECCLCRICVSECPAEAITIKASGLTTDPEKCILCMRCTVVCPSDARKLADETLAAVTARIESRCNGRRETEIFYDIA